jgi:ESCRT-II complex subunit VPS22
VITFSDLHILLWNSDDILRAVKSLEPLGSGFSIINVGQKQFIRSIPKELNLDQATVLEVVQISGFVTVSMLQLNLGWEKARSKTVIDDLLADGLVWLDSQCPEEEYWSPQNLLDDG